MLYGSFFYVYLSLSFYREDNELNIAKQPAVRKISMLPNVMSQLKKVWPMLIQLCWMIDQLWRLIPQIKYRYRYVLGAKLTGENWGTGV